MQHFTTEDEQHKPSQPVATKFNAPKIVDGNVVDLYGSYVPQYKADETACTEKMAKTNQTRFGLEERGVGELPTE